MHFSNRILKNATFSQSFAKDIVLDPTHLSRNLCYG